MATKKNWKQLYKKIFEAGIYTGSFDEYTKLTFNEHLKIDFLLKLKNLIDTGEFKKIGFEGTFDDFLKLPESKQEEIKKLYNNKRVEARELAEKKSEYETFKQNNRFYNKSFEEYLKQSPEERHETEIKEQINSYEKIKERTFTKIEQGYQKFKQCQEENFREMKEEYELGQVYLNKFHEYRLYLINECQEANIPVPNNIKKEVIDVNIKKPKFGFLDNKKYKILDSLLTEKYIYKLKARQIDSIFKTEQDYNNKNKWKEFIDTKEKEYEKLKSKYFGTFENYLQENTIVTLEYQTYGESETKLNEEVENIKQRHEEKHKRMQEENREFVNRVNAGFARLNEIRGSDAAQTIASSLASFGEDVLSGKTETPSPYGFKHGPKGSEDIYSDSMYDGNTPKKR